MRCDCHVHIVGPADAYPQAPTRTYLAGVAELVDLQRRAQARDIAHFVIVQASFYGTDNTLLLESLDRLGGHGRGVAVVDPAASPSALADYARRGVRGLRVNLYTPMNLREPRQLDDAFNATAALARTMDWHVQVIAPIRMLGEAYDTLARSAVPVVLDHYGLHGAASPESADGRRLLDLLRLPHVWIKLSAPYRVCDDPLATGPNAAWLAAILAAAEERCVWGSDWPHTPPHSTHAGAGSHVPYRTLDYAAVVDGFLAALGSSERADRIMGENPARLYDFPR